MFHANYYSNDAKVHRWMMAQHYVDCVECGRPDCGHFAKQTKNHRHVVRGETPQRVLLRAHFAEVEAIGINIIHVA